MAIVTLRYWAAAKEAAGISEEKVQADNLAAALKAGLAGSDGRLSQVIARSSFLVNDEPAGTRDPASIDLADGAVIEVLPPFAGG